MLSNNPRITDLMFESTIAKLAKDRGITIEESRLEISKMSFSQYLNLIEASANISSPSGQTIGPSAAKQASPTSNTQVPQTAPAKQQVMWNGPGAPIEKGMTVKLKGPNGLPVAGVISQVDQSAHGVKVKNPITGQDEWHGNDDLEPYAGGDTVPGATPQAAGLHQQQVAEEISRMQQLANIGEDTGHDAGSYPHDFSNFQQDAQAAGHRIVAQPQDDTGNMTQNFQVHDSNGNQVGYWDGAQGSGIIAKSPEDYQQRIGNKGMSSYNRDQYQKDVSSIPAPSMSEEISRMRQLAGIAEDASGGASCAGGIATAPVAMGAMKKRTQVEEGPSEEYTPGVAKTVAGDTKPNQATGRLSANLAARGKKTASRINNGFKK